MTVREALEQREKSFLSPYAALSVNAKRAREEEKCDIRTEYQRDRDRIIHCKSFRRLKRKTQVFLSPEGDHYRTRLTHTLEVAQIGRTIARALNLNEDLVEAAALGHDLGHTPFGHAGERALDEVSSFGFVHSRQSVRVAEIIEKSGSGLNLTEDTLNAIACHSGGDDAATLEGKILRFADKLAYMNHDVDDAIRGGIICNEDIPFEIRAALGPNSSIRINTMVNAVVDASFGKDDVLMQKDIWEACEELKKFMFANVYIKSAAKTQEGKAENLVKELYCYYMETPQLLPDEYKLIAQRESEERAVVDFVAGMTDNYAVHLYTRLKLPFRWEY